MSAANDVTQWQTHQATVVLRQTDACLTMRNQPHALPLLLHAGRVGLNGPPGGHAEVYNIDFLPGSTSMSTQHLPGPA